MSMSKSKIVFGVLAVAGLAVAFALLFQKQATLHQENDSLRQQLTQLENDNENLSNRLAVVGKSRNPAEDQLRELLKLRGEVGLLQRQVGEIGKLRDEIQRLQAAPRNPQPLPASADALEQQQQAAMVSLNRARQGILGFIMFADANQQQFPPSFAEAAPYFKEGLDPIAMNFEIVYIGSITNITNVATTVVLREKHATQTLDGKWRKTYGFADGHAEIHTEPDGNFDDWESKHIIPPPPSQ